jgi:hypothetical protein
MMFSLKWDVSAFISDEMRRIDEASTERSSETFGRSASI